MTKNAETVKSNQTQILSKLLIFSSLRAKTQRRGKILGWFQFSLSLLATYLKLLAVRLTME
jgi:hypothetical protein